MSAASLRRSGRRAIRKNSDYNVGDVVEVARNESVVKGKLLQELSEGKTANPRWLVAFIDEPAWKDEELYEKAFGKQWHEGETEAHPKPPRVRTKPLVAVPPTKSTSKIVGGSLKSDSSSETEESRTSKKKSVSFTESPGASGSDSSPKRMRAAAAAARKSSREQRSLRRQSHVGPEVVGGVLPPMAASHNKRDRAPTSNLPDSKKTRKDEEVIKVPMLTGTLYLYRGPVRRAEFVRRV
mmetsp:Transcript_3592/g.6031  ORF Transcript_3592/g.6031 Transcript_3592/m.6031 type:complete len:239 (-) Transcript_3592:145-861(-)|eukprot:CAMPEP_0119006638 /NCGR_PEP_ID=MMETSP1176-20130426/2434_1 /TAXON_ID=265551 /ORGANISM="Synedropsis recta cf, Strain CCMP1620" /LENGTH=238 /DNA_ID=CAMNT_0006958589 /DNA_START=33 /DNA_END=749 /DNA_ORIENTATION=-